MRPGCSPGALSMEGAGAGSCLCPCLPLVSWDAACQSGASALCDQHPARHQCWPCERLQMAAHEQRDGDGHACPVPGHAGQGVAGPAAGRERAHSGLVWSSAWGGGTRQRVLGRANPTMLRNVGRSLCLHQGWGGGTISWCGVDSCSSHPGAVAKPGRREGDQVHPVKSPQAGTGLTLACPHQGHREAPGGAAKSGCLPGESQLHQPAGACTGTADPVLQPARGPGHPSRQPHGHPLHPPGCQVCAGLPWGGLRLGLAPLSLWDVGARLSQSCLAQAPRLLGRWLQRLGLHDDAFVGRGPLWGMGAGDREHQRCQQLW